jgi:hypothetical protein
MWFKVELWKWVEFSSFCKFVQVHVRMYGIRMTTSWFTVPAQRSTIPQTTYRDAHTTILRIMTILEVLFIPVKVGRDEPYKQNKDEEGEGELAHHDQCQ